MSPSLYIRPLGPDDQALLWDVLHIALWDPPPALLRPKAILQSPHIRIYAENWGRAGDIGLVLELAKEGEPIGACWMRLLGDQRGLAFVDAATPHLGIGLFPCFQGKAYGHGLMLAALDAARAAGFRQVSLTVHRAHPAIKMYERCGFQQYTFRKSYQVMVVTL
ncbi:MAG: GNAT family N-acetyltransferase [Burkholderiales bacterium]|nr:GNAT family N-acetyltransferase [Burkholderiales bacterium]